MKEQCAICYGATLKKQNLDGVSLLVELAGFGVWTSQKNSCITISLSSLLEPIS